MCSFVCVQIPSISILPYTPKGIINRKLKTASFLFFVTKQSCLNCKNSGSIVDTVPMHLKFHQNALEHVISQDLALLISLPLFVGQISITTTTKKNAKKTGLVIPYMSYIINYFISTRGKW